MADANDPNNPESVAPNPEEMERSKQGIDELTNAIDGTTSSLEKATAGISGFADSLYGLGDTSSAVQSVIRTFTSTAEATEQAKQKTIEYKKEAGGLAEAFNKGGISGVFKDLTNTINTGLEAVEESMGGKMSAGVEAAKIALISLKKTGLETIDSFLKQKAGVGFDDLESTLKQAERAAINARMAFGDTFDEAESSVGLYRRTLEDSIDTTRASMEEVVNVRSALSQAFDTTEMTRGLGNLQAAQDGLTSSINLTNVALLAAAATGADNAQVAEILGRAHLELGESVDTAGLALADIADAAEGSGLRFTEVSESIMNAASTLRMWGGTISSVTPVFKSFVDTLGEGRKGLATDLMEQYISGIQKMGLSTRAFLGTAQGMGGPGGALGAGLEMEAAMEKGAEGMEQITSNLVERLGQIGGAGGVITREQAIDSPQLQQQFVAQRKLLQQMIGVDEASATQMMKLLQDVEQSGLEAGEDTKEKLSELMQSGESAQESTQTVLERTSQELKRATLDSGEVVVRAIRDLARGSGFSKAAANIQRSIENFGRNTEEEDEGQQMSEELRRQLGAGDQSGRGQRRREEQMLRGAGARKDREQRVPDINRALRNIQAREGATTMNKIIQRAPEGASEKGQRVMVEANNQIMRAMSNLQTKAEGRRGSGYDRAALNIWEKASSTVSDRISELNKRGEKREEGLTAGEKKEISMLSDFLSSAEKTILEGRTVREAIKSMSEGRTEQKESDVQKRDRARGQERASDAQRRTRRDRREPGAARRRVERRPEQREQAPVRDTAEQAARVKEERVKFNFTSEPIEQEFKIKLVPGQESVNIKVDDEHIKDVIRRMKTVETAEH